MADKPEAALFCDNLPLQLANPKIGGQVNETISMTIIPPHRVDCEVAVYLTPWTKWNSWRCQLPPAKHHKLFNKNFPDSHYHFSSGSTRSFGLDFNFSATTTAKNFVLVGSRGNLQLSPDSSLFRVADTFPKGAATAGSKLRTKLFIELSVGFSGQNMMQTAKMHLIRDNRSSDIFSKAVRVCKFSDKKCLVAAVAKLATYHYADIDIFQFQSWTLQKAAGNFHILSEHFSYNILSRQYL